jgi:hypothetical protein
VHEAQFKRFRRMRQEFYGIVFSGEFSKKINSARNASQIVVIGIMGNASIEIKFQPRSICK